MTTVFNVGDIVCHTSKFLRSIGWVLDVPKNGKVLEVQGAYLLVQWCDCDEAVRIHSANVMRFDKRHLELR